MSVFSKIFTKFIRSRAANFSGPDPEHSNTGGGHQGRTQNTRIRGYDVSGVSRKGESMRGGLPLSYRGPGGDPPKNFGKLCCRRSIFEACLRSKCQVSNLILKASLTHFMQYFASSLAYTGAVAGIQRKRKAMIRI